VGSVPDSHSIHAGHHPLVPREGRFQRILLADLVLIPSIEPSVCPPAGEDGTSVQKTTHQPNDHSIYVKKGEIHGKDEWVRMMDRRPLCSNIDVQQDKKCLEFS
jgi:hypothetical protein